MLIDDLHENAPEKLDAVLERGPIVSFFLERIEPLLNPAGPSDPQV
jgi:hypothetical protein